MVKKKKNPSFIISLVLHLLLLAAGMGLHSAQILVPSRSDGMEVSLITPAELSTPSRQVVLEKTVQPDRLQDTAGDINLKQETEKKTQTAKLVQPKAAETPAPPVPTPLIKKTKKPVVNKQVSDLLSDLVPTQNAGHSKGSAKGGSNLGTSDTDNLQANYADLVIARVRPFVTIPDGMDDQAKAVVEVTLLPNMNVYKVRLVKSSGNPAYDAGIQQAITRAAVFPPLPDGADFKDYRKIKLTFRPQ